MSSIDEIVDNFVLILFRNKVVKDDKPLRIIPLESLIQRNDFSRSHGITESRNIQLRDQFFLKNRPGGIDIYPDEDSLQREEFHRNGEDYKSCEEGCLFFHFLMDRQ